MKTLLTTLATLLITCPALANVIVTGTARATLPLDAQVFTYRLEVSTFGTTPQATQAIQTAVSDLNNKLIMTGVKPADISYTPPTFSAVSWSPITTNPNLPPEPN